MKALSESLEAFLFKAGWQQAGRTDLAADASTRHFIRLNQEQYQAILMVDRQDLPQAVTSVQGFVRTTQLLRRSSFSAPEILAADPPNGLLLVEDFGDQTFAHLLDQGAAAEPLYQKAIDLLIALHQRIDGTDEKLADWPTFDDALFINLVLLFLDFPPAPIDKTGRQRFEVIWHELFHNAPPLPCSLLLRDFHMGNLMYLPEREDICQCGLIDFQDAGRGPIIYDLISLLEDARRDLSPALTNRLHRRYYAACDSALQAMLEAAWPVYAAQRHLRIIAVFNRLAQQHGKPDYLRHLPRLYRYLATHLQAAALKPLADWFDIYLPHLFAVEQQNEDWS